MRNPSILPALFDLSAIALHADVAPALQWVQALSGSGTNMVTGAAADSQGNFHVVGNTTSLDFPVTAALQPAAGASTLVRIDTATGASRKFYPRGHLLGNITSLAADPRNPNTIYGAAANTVWRSTDAGVTWTVLLQLGEPVTITSVAVDPSNSNNLYVASDQSAFKSTDGGVTWTAISYGIKMGQFGTDLSYIAVDPNAPQVIFAIAPAGLIRSPDGGTTWKLVVSAEVLFKTLVFDPFAPGTVYLALAYDILKSTDDGQTFTTEFSLPNYNSPTSMVADPFHPGVLFAACQGTGVYQSADSGATWTLKSATSATLLAADPNRAVFYAYDPTYGVVATPDGFATTSPIGPPETSLRQLLAAGPNLFLAALPTNDVFVVKFDPAGNVVYSTYFGGSADDLAAAMTAGADGSVYVTGTTTSADFPVTAGAFRSVRPSSTILNPVPFLFKLNRDGSLAWSIYFADFSTTPGAVAVDSDGSPYVATSVPSPCIEIWPAGCFPGPPIVSVTKFHPKGTALTYSGQAFTASSYVFYPGTSRTPLGLAVNSNGNAYVGGDGQIALLNSTGSVVLSSTPANGLAITALALDANSNLYATGWWTGSQNIPFPSTPGAFQPGSQPAIPVLPGDLPGNAADAFVAKWDGGLSGILAATLLGGESTDQGQSIAIDSSGNVIVSGFTDSLAFPTHAPFQASFSPRSGFVAALDASLSHLLFSTYVGDVRPFDAVAAVPDGNGNVLLAGSTLAQSSAYNQSDPGASYANGRLVVANKIALQPAPAARLDSVVNAASLLAAPISPGETVAAIGAGFGSDAQLLLGGIPLAPVLRTANLLEAAMPATAATSGASVVRVLTGGALSNYM